VSSDYAQGQVSGAETIDPSDRPPRVALKMWLGFAAAAALIVLCTAGATVGVGMVQLHQVTTIIHKFGHIERFQPGTITAPPSGKPQTILLVGSDRRYGDPHGAAHSDTLMLVRLDPRQQATTVLSIPRDLKVEIPGHGTSKINAAYGEGGLDLTVRTIKNVLGTPGHPFKINHAIAVNFRGFRDAVRIIHCVYVDVDRRYYHSNVGVPVGQRYAEINVQPGYQRLCGANALAYVRFRHQDNDLVRAARQQDFLRAAGDELSTSRLITHIKPLVKAFAQSTATDANLQTAKGILRLLHLAVGLAGHPVRQVRFPATLVSSPVVQTPSVGVNGQQTFTQTVTGLGDYVTATPQQIHRAVQQFLHPPVVKRTIRPPGPPATPRGHRKKVKVTPAQYGLIDAWSTTKALVRPELRSHHLRFAFYGPRWLTSRGRYAQDQPPNAPSPRIYWILDSHGRRHQAYRLVVEQNALQGQYYGVEGTRWKDPPILNSPSSTVHLGGRSFELYNDGKHIRVVAWRTPKAVYWVSNTLTRSLTNKQMLGIARSLTRVKR
jgi:polyisoprenyl-teichoic acid--peptidoglycan teichoic acid transferase